VKETVPCLDSLRAIGLELLLADGVIIRGRRLV